jgi:hypothetical protein
MFRTIHIMPIVSEISQKFRNIKSNFFLQKFRTSRGNILTLNILEMDIEDKAWGQLQVYDGPSDQYRHLVTFQIRNGTIPQGVSTTDDTMFVKFTWQVPPTCPSLKQCIKFTLLVDSGPSMWDSVTF